MNRIRRVLQSGTVYAEHRLLLLVLQLFGVAPFIVRRHQPRASNFHPVSFLTQSVILIYCLYDSKLNNHFNRLSRYTLTVIFYDVVSILGAIYNVFTLARLLWKKRTCMRVWSTIEEINGELTGIGVNPSRSTIWNILKTSAVLSLYGAFIVATYNLQSNKSKLTAQFWVVWYLPLFHCILIELAFHECCTDLKRKFAMVNGVLETVVKERRTGRREPDSRRIRTLRVIHYKGYQISRDMDSLYGLHFLYMFVWYFLGGTLNFCIIIRLHGKTGPSSSVRYASAVYWTVIQVVQILNIVFSGVFLRKEVRRMTLLVHQYLILLDERETRLKLELQSFSLQLMQCPLNFTAAGFFNIDCILLLQLGVAVVSNTLLFVQIDKLKKRS